MRSQIERDPGDSMGRAKTDYRSYLLRLWWAEDEDETAIRIYVEDPLTGERIGFTCLEQLVAFLSEEIHLIKNNQKETLSEDHQ